MIDTTSLKQYGKFKDEHLGKVELSAVATEANKAFWFNFYIDYFITLITNFIEWDNVPDTIDPLWIEKHICGNGYIGIFNDEKFGLIAQSGTMGEELDLYENPTHFVPVNGSTIQFTKRKIHWYSDIIKNDNKIINKTQIESLQNRDKCVIIGNNNYYSSSFTWIRGFAQKLADIEQAIQLNRNAQLMPYIVLADDDRILDMKRIFTKIINGEPVVYVKTQKNKSGNVEAVQLSDMIDIKNTQSPYIIDKLTDDRNSVLFQVLTKIGIKTSPIDKRERVNDTEANSNNGLLASNINAMVKTRKIGAKHANEYFGLNLEPHVSDMIEEFNMDSVYDDITETVEEIHKGDD